jgi:hypothetical protein
MTCPAVVKVTVPGGPAVVRVTAQSAPAVVRVATPGLRGIQGLPGPAGPPSPTHTHNQPSAATTWIMNHNLGFRPSVELFNTGAQEIEADVFHPSVNQAVAVFTTPVAGFARLN